MIRCLYCNAAAAITVTSELNGVLAHYPACDAHIERAAAQVRAERGRVRAGLDPFTGRVAGEPDEVTIRHAWPGSVDAVAEERIVHGLPPAV